MSGMWSRKRCSRLLVELVLQQVQGAGKEKTQMTLVETLKEGGVGEPMEMQRRTLLCSRRVSFILHGSWAGTGLVWGTVSDER